MEDNQSEYTFRPIFICPGKEDSKLVRLLIERMDKECEENQIIRIEFGDLTVIINVNYHPGGDGKAANTCTGLSGKLHTTYTYHRVQQLLEQRYLEQRGP